jgi:hypothetical protein
VKPLRLQLLWLPCAAVVLLTARTRVIGDEPASPAAEQIEFFETKIRPLLAERCYDCHGPETQESDLRLDTLEGMLLGGKGGPAVAPAKPGGSLLITAVSYADNDLKMPPDEKLSDREIADLTRWIEIGAPHPDSGSVKSLPPASRIDLVEGRKHWAFRAPVKPELPVPADGGPVVNPIDAFLWRALKERGLSPLGRADKRTLIRRATFDLIGLPPTPDEIEDFLADDSESAFQRVVDRLLESPHYGERWGRHWLDIARYADSNGLDENVAHGNAWRYRDYVVRSLNADKPYDQFLIEQIAGDLLPRTGDLERDHDQLIATGFLSLGPKVLAEVDKTKLAMDIVDEQLDTLGRSTMGLTLGCARCHDHKFDPVGQRDYYALAGIFRSTRTMETLKTIARWNENVIATPEQSQALEEHKRQAAEKNQAIAAKVAEATKALNLPEGEAVPKDVEAKFPAEVREELKRLREELKQFEEAEPVLPTAMGVVDGEVADTAIHLRGSHLTLGEVIPRGFPAVIAGEDQPELPESESGRLQLARWLADPAHPLTARVMVNRIWRWHFGDGLVDTVDNFGRQGARPSHPELLDWLAVRFVEEGWSIKSMHRLIMLSDAWQRSSGFDSRNAGIDPENRFYWRRDVERLEAEAIRDALLAVSGTLDPAMGGSLLTVKNREFLFNHTSQDHSSYSDIRRRSLYVPVIRNHLYDLFQLFDYADADVLNGDRNVSTIAPQALLMMNSDFVAELSAALADRVRGSGGTFAERVQVLFELAYARPATETELERMEAFLAQFRAISGETDEAARQAWRTLCQSVLSSSEFVYVR